jgi:phosphoglycerate dehydrogenase-like enzyme
VAVSVLVLGRNIDPDLSFLDEFGDRIEVFDANREGADQPALLGRAEVALIGFPMPEKIAAGAPHLRWVHHTQAGVSNFLRSDLWASDIALTSTRGHVAATAIAESAMAGVFFFARGLITALEQKHQGRFTRRGYEMTVLHGATLGVVGLGGIGREVARIASGVGMRVVATRWSISSPEHDVDNVEVVLPASELQSLLAQSDYVVVCSQLTDTTRGMFDAAAFASVKPGAVFVNIARGEEVDEDALIGAVRSGRLRGAYLDVHAGESAGQGPRQELLEMPNILVTPHNSPGGDPDPGVFAIQLFVENLHRYLNGEPLLNLVDRVRGY